MFYVSAKAAEHRQIIINVKIKQMKLKDLKKQLEKLSKEQLEQELLYNSTEYSVSGVVAKISRAKANLYNTHEDDPATLYTLKELKEQGMDKEEIESCDIEIPKGAFVIEF
jgi:hypothetical protein